MTEKKRSLVSMTLKGAFLLQQIAVLIQLNKERMALSCKKGSVLFVFPKKELNHEHDVKPKQKTSV
jgi:hypothetical protein